LNKDIFRPKKIVTFALLSQNDKFFAKLQKKLLTKNITSAIL